jgi:hypothetical protein
MDVEKFVRHLCRLVLRHQMPVWNYSFYSAVSVKLGLYLLDSEGTLHLSEVQCRRLRPEGRQLNRLLWDVLVLLTFLSLHHDCCQTVISLVSKDFIDPNTLEVKNRLTITLNNFNIYFSAY